MNFKDEELTEEELREVTAGIKKGNTNKMLDLLGKQELEQLKDKVEKELSLDELDNIKAGMPQEMIENNKEKNKDIFRKM